MAIKELGYVFISSSSSFFFLKILCHTVPSNIKLIYSKEKPYRVTEAIVVIKRKDILLLKESEEASVKEHLAGF